MWLFFCFAKIQWIQKNIALKFIKFCVSFRIEKRMHNLYRENLILVEMHGYSKIGQVLDRIKFSEKWISRTSILLSLRHSQPN